MWAKGHTIFQPRLPRLKPRNDIKRSTAFTLTFSLILGLTLPILGLITPPTVKASVGNWWNEDYRYRLPLDITSSTTQSNVYYQLSLDTTTNFNPDCSDLRFITESGVIIPHHLSSGCGTSNTQIQLLFSQLPQGTTPIHLYYSNPEANNISSLDSFNNPATGITHSLQAVQQSPSPLAHWKFDEGYGAIANSSTTTNYPATLNGPTWQSQENCPSNRCLNFDGIDDYLEVSDTPNLHLNTSDFTLSAWVRSGSANAASDHQGIITKGSTGAITGQFSLYQHVSGKLQFIRENQIALQGSTNTRDGQWHLVVAVRQGSQLTLYVDGQAEATDPLYFQGVTLNTNGILKIGYRDGNRYFKGSIDDPKIYTYPRTQQQIQYDYLQGIQSLTQQQTNLTNGLVAHYQFNEQSYTGVAGEVKDISGNKQHAQTFGSPPVTTGKYGSAPSFNGLDQYVTIPENDSLDIRTGSMTWSLWFKTTSSDRGIIYRKSDSANTNGVLIDISSVVPGRVRCHMDNVLNVVAYSQANTYNDNQWHNVICILNRSSNQLSLTLDGALQQIVNASSLAGSDLNSAAAPTIAQGGPPFFNGQVDELRLYNRALTSQEVTQLYNYAPPPVAYYDFEEGSGNTLYDKSGNNFNGTWSGTGDRYTKGQQGKGGGFDGSTNRISAPASTALDWQKSYTISTFINPAKFGNPASDCADKRAYLISTLAGISPNFHFVDLAILNTGSIKFWHAGQDNIYDGAIVSSPISQLNQWYYITVANNADAQEVTLYINGLAMAKSSYAGKTLTAITGQPLRFGQNVHNCAATYYSGQLDEIKLYNYTLTPSQVLSDMQATNPNQSEPMGYYKFDENQGLTAQNSGVAGSPTNATLINMSSPPTSTSGWTANGAQNATLNFDGSNDYLTAPHSPAYNIPITGDYAVSLWLKTTQTTSVRLVNKLWQEINVGEHGWLIDLNTITPGSIRFRITNQPASNYDFSTPATNINNGQWHHLLVNLNYQQQAKIEIYLDGQFVARSTSLPFHPTLANTTVSLGIGAIPGLLGQYFAGSLDEVKIYNSALTPQQIAIDYNQSSSQVIGSPSTEPTLTQSGTTNTKPSSSQSSTYCVPGSTDYCTPPVLHYNFEEGSGSTLKDISGNGTAATFTGNPPIWTTGKYGKSIDFSQIDTTYAATSSQPLNNPDAWTYTTWFYPTAGSLSTADGLIGQGNNPRLTYGASVGAGNKKVQILAGWSESPGYKLVTSPSDLNLNQWYHLEAVFDASNPSNQTITLYINGQQVAQTTATTGALTRPNSYHYLARRDSTYGLPGLLDEVKIYNYARTPSQVAWDYNNGAPLAHYKLDECSGATIHDSSGNNLHAVLIPGVATPGTCTTTGLWNAGASGKYNASLSLDGQSYVGNSPSIVEPRSGTFSQWIKADSSMLAPGSYASFTRYSNSDGIFVQPGTGRLYLQLALDGVNKVCITSNTPVIPNTWQHFVGTYQQIGLNTQLKLYLNAKPLCNITHPGLVSISGTQKIMFGTQGYQGQIDDVQIFNYALTDKQVQTLYNNGAVYWGK